MSIEAFMRAEAKRAANRLHYEWKKNPWLPGATIDLGTFEARFQTESGVARLGAPVAPAVLDWLRWKYRRLQLDRNRDDEWGRVLREDYPRRVRDAGPRPPESYSSSGDEPSPPAWTANRGLVTSKRQRQDRVPVKAQPQPRLLRERQPDKPVDANALALFVVEHNALLNPLLAKCLSETEQRSLVMALRAYLTDPADTAAAERWRDSVNELWSR